MPEVFIKKDESLDYALRRFKRECEREKIIQDVRKHEFYEKPSERRKRKMQAAKKRERRRRREEEREFL